MEKRYSAIYCSHFESSADRMFDRVEDAIAYVLNNNDKVNQVNELKINEGRVVKMENIFCEPNGKNLRYTDEGVYRCGKKQFTIKKNGKDRYDLKIVDDNAAKVEVNDKECVGINFDGIDYLLISVINNAKQEVELWGIPKVNQVFEADRFLKFKRA